MCFLNLYITAPPQTMHISHIDIGLIQLTFTWSPVAPDHDYSAFDYMYNILASNCGSCPTTTNYTAVTCTDVPANGSTCTLAVQTVVCTEYTDCATGISSDSISIKVLNTRSSHDTVEHSSTDSMFIASIIFLVASMATCIAVTMMVIVTVLTRKSARIKIRFWWFVANKQNINSDTHRRNV